MAEFSESPFFPSSYGAAESRGRAVFFGFFRSDRTGELRYQHKTSAPPSGKTVRVQSEVGVRLERKQAAAEALSRSGRLQKMSQEKGVGGPDGCSSRQTVTQTLPFGVAAEQPVACASTPGVLTTPAEHAVAAPLRRMTESRRGMTESPRGWEESAMPGES
jgi:hypothetical protein